MTSSNLFQRSFLLLALIAFSAIGRLSAQTTLLDTFSSATNFTFSGTEPRTYMGNSFTNNSLPAGTGSFQITSLTIYMASVTATNYTDISARIQFWNTTNAASTPVFSNAAGPLLTLSLGPLSTMANSFYTFNITLTTPITLTGGSGTNWGFVQNFQGDTGSGLMDTTNLTSLITYNTNGGYAAGQITNGTAPNQGYYRNASGRTDFNFASTDSRTLSLNSQGIGIIIRGNPIPVPEPSSVALLGLSGVGLAVAAFRARRRRA